MADDDSEVLWAFPYGNISHIVFRGEGEREGDSDDSPGVELVVYTKRVVEGRPMGLALHSGESLAMTVSQGSGSGASGSENVEFLKCANREIAALLYAQLAQSSFRMGNPSSVVPPELATAPKVNPTGAALGPAPTRTNRGWKYKPAEQLSRVDNTAMPGGLVGLGLGLGVGVGVRGWKYQFGAANRIPVRKGNWAESEVLQRAATRLMRDTTGFEAQGAGGAGRDDASGEHDHGDDHEHDAEATEAASRLRLEDNIHRAIDERVWALLCEWSCTHIMFNTSRCLALTVLNHSPNPVQVQRVDFKEGKNYHLFGVGVGGGYDSEARTILPGGALVVFSYAPRPTLIDLAHVKLVLQTSAFTAQVSTRPDRTECSAVGGFTAGYLEKSLEDVWGKFVLLVT